MPDILLSDFEPLGRCTNSANATAADINTGKTAIVDGAAIVGTGQVKPLPEQNGVFFLATTPIGIVDSSYQPHTDHGTILIQATTLTSVYSSPNWVLAKSGWAYNLTDTYASFATAAMGPFTDFRRVYEFWGAVQNVTLTDAYGVRILFNWVDANNYWQVALRWSTGSAAFYMTIWEYTAGVGNTRATITFSTALDLPARWHLIVTEQGDAIIAQCFMNEIDSYADDYAYSISYSVASRPNKNTGTFSFSMQGGIVGAEWLVAGCRILNMA